MTIASMLAPAGLVAVARTAPGGGWTRVFTLKGLPQADKNRIATAVAIKPDAERSEQDRIELMLF
jgi:hypothetical protein